MPKHKQLLGFDKKKTKRAAAAPETADEFLAAGVAEEEAGGKWRAGDAAKSLRFFSRAVDIYTQGLRAFPQSSDLAYNKARLEYEITQEQRFSGLLPVAPSKLLQETLQSHRYTLSLKNDDADALFNTAQVLSSLAEAVAEEGGTEGASRDEALHFYQEALVLFQKCLITQEISYTQFETELAEAQELQSSQLQPQPEIRLNSNDDAAPPNKTGSSQVESSSSSQDEQWTSIIEPVTKQTLFDTVLAEMDTISMICSLTRFSNPTMLAELGELTASLIQKAESYLTPEVDQSSNIIASNTASAKQVEEEREEQQKLRREQILSLALSKASLVVSYADVSYRNESLDWQTYVSHVKEAYEQIPTDQSSSLLPAQALFDRAEALITMHTSIYAGSFAAMFASTSVSSQFNGAEAVLWRSLTQALDDLLAASKVSSSTASLSTSGGSSITVDVSRIHERRGDCEMLRYRLGFPHVGYDLAIKSRSVLLKNAETFYRGAVRAAIATTSSGGGDTGSKDTEEARIKEAIVGRLRAIGPGGGNSQEPPSSSDALEALLTARSGGSSEQAIVRVVGDMARDTMLGEEDLKVLVYTDSTDTGLSLMRLLRQ